MQCGILWVWVVFFIDNKKKHNVNPFCALPTSISTGIGMKNKNIPKPMLGVHGAALFDRD